MKRIAASLVAVLASISAGCATLPGIQQSPPILALDAVAPPARTAECIVAEVTQAGEDFSILRPPWDPPASQKVGEDYRVLLVGPGGGSALSEVTVSPAGTGSRVEVRAKPWDSQAAFLDAVRKCGKAG
jgi:hypothetical protein